MAEKITYDKLNTALGLPRPLAPNASIREYINPNTVKGLENKVNMHNNLGLPRRLTEDEWRNLNTVRDLKHKVNEVNEMKKLSNVLEKLANVVKVQNEDGTNFLIPVSSPLNKSRSEQELLHGLAMNSKYQDSRDANKVNKGILKIKRNENSEPYTLDYERSRSEKVTDSFKDLAIMGAGGATAHQLFNPGGKLPTAPTAALIAGGAVGSYALLNDPIQKIINNKRKENALKQMRVNLTL